MQTITGDLLKIESGILIHQVNCMGVTGGLAGSLRRKHPKAFQVYDHACKSPPLTICGQASIGEATPTLRIAHLFGQIQPGPNTNLTLVNRALENLVLMLRGCQTEPIYAPFQMGCGLGGGDWSKYEPLLEKHLPQLTIVKLQDE